MFLHDIVLNLGCPIYNSFLFISFKFRNNYPHSSEVVNANWKEIPVFPNCLDKPVVHIGQKCCHLLVQKWLWFLLLHLFYYIRKTRFHLQELISIYFYYFKICSIERTNSNRTGVREISECIRALLWLLYQAGISDEPLSSRTRIPAPTRKVK
jgi:hypothetical protein